MTLPPEIQLVIFDLDGTLCAFPGDDILPHVQTTLDALKVSHPHLKYAVASNQGGVGLRHWMQTGGFGEPAKYPTEAQAVARLEGVLNALPLDGCLPLISFAYLAAKGNKWAPTPHDKMGLPAWSREWRKPHPGMLLRAMQHFQVEPAVTLMVGDSNEDSAGAVNAGCAFCWATEFFSVSTRTDEETLSALKDFDFGLE